MLLQILIIVATKESIDEWMEMMGEWISAIQWPAILHVVKRVLGVDRSTTQAQVAVTYFDMHIGEIVEGVRQDGKWALLSAYNETQITNLTFTSCEVTQIALDLRSSSPAPAHSKSTA